LKEKMIGRARAFLKRQKLERVTSVNWSEGAEVARTGTTPPVSWAVMGVSPERA